MKKYLHIKPLVRISAVTIIFIVLSIPKLLAQDDMRYCNDSWNCTANDAGLDSVYLVADASGTPLSNNVCATADSIDAFIRGDIYVTAANRYDIAFYADLYVNGDSVGTVKKFAGDYSSGNYSIDFGQIKWACGDKLELRNIYVFWLQNGNSKLGRFHTCEESYTTSKCRGTQGINKIITTPVTGYFDFIACNNNDNGIDAVFTAYPAGGSEKYLYSWDFNGDGIEDSSDSIATYTSYNNSDNVTLIITDLNDNTKFATINETVAYPAEISISGTVSCTNNTGNIDLTVTGGTPYNSSPSYNFEWKDDNGTVISTNEDATNLVNGISYTVTVTDSAQCSISESYLINCCELTVECNPVTSTLQGYENLPPVAATTAELKAIGITVTDSCGNIQISAATDADPGCEGTVHRTYTITDGTNTIECTQTFEILPTDPVITCPEDMVVYTTENSLKSAGTEGIKILRSPESYSSNQLKSALMLKSAGDVVNGFLTLGGWDSQGVPDYLEPTDDVIGQDFVDDIDNSLPESENLLNTHPEYLASGTETNLQLTKEAEVWVTYITEGAGYKNVLGYFHFPTDNPPTSKSEIEDEIVIFPNSSFDGSGGGLFSGNKVQLKYKNPSTGTLQDTFPANTTIGWLLGADGWDGSNPTAGKYMHYSIPGFNVESESNLQQHNVLLYDDLRKILVLGFEDIRRDDNSCDNDFNDVIFYSTVSPASAINTTELASIDRPSCTKEITLDPPTIVDECGLVGEVYHNAPDSFIVGETVVDWTIEDADGNIIYTCQQTVHLIDDFLPTISGPGDITVYTDPGTCEATSVNLGFPEFSDDCAVQNLENDGVEPYPLGETTVTWTVTDYAGNEATSVQKVTVLDTVAPTVTCNDVTLLGCSTDEITGLAYSETETEITLNQLNTDGATTSDNCEIETITYYDISSGTNPLIVTRTYTVTDKSGNSGTCTKTITIEDTEVPTASKPVNITIQCTDDLPEPDVTVITDEADNHTANPVVEFVNDVSDNQTCPETITRTYSVTDECGNSVNVSQNIIINDITLPSASNPATITVQCIDEVPDPDISVVTDEVDNCTAEPVVAFVNDSSDGLTCPETITRTFSVTDDCNNSIEVTQLIIIKDETDPEIACVSNQERVLGSDKNLYLTNGNEFDLTLAEDNCGIKTVTNNLNGSSTLDGYSFPVGTSEVTWTVVDECNNQSECSFTVTIFDPSYSIEKRITDIDGEGSGGSVNEAGNMISYEIIVANTGNMNLTGITVSDPLIASNLSAPSESLTDDDILEENETWTYTGTYTVQQSDINDNGGGDGDIDNTATVSSNELLDETASAEATISVVPAVSINKTADITSGVKAGDIIKYFYEVTNTGNVTLTDVSVSDIVDQGTGTLSAVTPASAGPLAPTETATFTATYVVTQQDIDNQAAISNLATVTAEDPDGNQVTGTDDESVTPQQNAASVAVDKTADVTTGVVAGQTITYTYVVTNGGNVTVDNVSVSDDHNGTGTLSAVTPASAGPLAPTETATFTATYVVTQQDIDNQAAISNLATVTAEDPDGNQVTGTDDESVTPQQNAASVAVDKTADVTTGVVAGQTITYTYVVTNGGNVTVDNVSVSDDHNGTGTLSAVTPASAGPLAPTETATFTATYVVTQQDIDNQAAISNLATVTAEDPDGNQVTGTDDESVTPQQNAASVAVDKTADVTTGVVAGQTITYTYVVTNGGNVTVDNVSVSDDHNGTGTLSAVTPASAGPLAPTETATFTATYVVTQQDIDNQAAISNLATVTAEDPDGNQVTGTDDESVTPQQNAASVAVDKTADVTTGVVAGQTITYTYVVTNGGNVTVDNVSVSDDHNGTGTLSAVTPASAGPLAPTETATFTATYVVTQQDIDNQAAISNLATVTAEDPDGNQVTGTDDESVTPQQNAASVAVDKTADVTTGVVAGQTITYTYVVTNGGNVTVDNVSVSDDHNGTGTLSAVTPASAGPLAPTETATFTATYVVTQQDIDNQAAISNLATVTAEDPDGNQVTGTDDESVTPQQNAASVAVDKTADVTTGVVAGQTITYTYVVTNGGNVTVDNVSVSDDHNGTGTLSAVTPASAGPLAPTETATFTATYVVTQQDIDNQAAISNLATVTAEDPDGNQVTGTDDESVTPQQNAASVAVDKTADVTTGVVAGQTITYTYVVTNGGNVTVDNVSVSDDHNGTGTLSAVTPASAGPLAPTETATFTATYVVTQQDIDNQAAISNLATVTAEDPDGNQVTGTDDESVTPQQNAASVAVDKTADVTTGVVAGQTITYTYVVTNGGNVTVDNVSVSDDHNGTGTLSAVTPASAGPLAPTETATFTATYVVTQQDIDNQAAISNLATVTAEDPDGNQVTGTDDESVTPQQNAASVAVDKTADVTTGVVAGQTITYTYVVTNGGNVTVDNVSVSDDHNGTGTLSAVTPASAGPLAPTETATFTATYVVTQQDIDNQAAISNLATVTAEDPDGNQVTGTDDESVTPQQNAASVAVDKTADVTTGVVAGQTITYTYVVTNGGNVTVDNVSVSDDHNGTGTLSAVTPASAGPLAPTETATFTATYVVTQQDIDNQAAISNLATVTAEDPDGNQVTGTDDESVTPQQNAASVAVDKTADVTTGVVAGQTITYTYVVTNGGNVTVDNVSVSDDHNGTGTLSAVTPASAGPLAPTETATFTATYVVTQQDIDNQAAISNLATVTAEDPDGNQVTGTDDESVTPQQNAASVAVDKTADVTTGVVAGQTITYTYVVTNGGNVTVDNVSVSDDHNGTGTLSAVTPASAGPLAPTETATFTATYVVTQQDIDNQAAISNLATVTAEDPDGNQVTGTDDESVTPQQNAASVAVDKTADVTTGVVAGQTITYTYVVTNGGNVTVDNVSVSDDHNGTGTLSAVTPASAGPLAPTETATFTATYVVTQQDIDNQAAISNLATVTAEDPDGNQVTGTDDESVTPQQNAASVAVDKTADVTTGVVAGQTITYTYVVTNGGNVTVDNVSVSDDHNGTGTLSAVTPASAGPLAPTETATFTATYVVTQQDIDNQAAISNLATVTAEDPDGNQVTGTDDESVTPQQNAASVAVDKTADVTTGVVAGQTITYTYVVTNGGNVTVDNVSVSDDHNGTGTLSAVTPASAGPLAPTETATFTATYVVTQQDIDNQAAISNLATVTAEDPDGNQVTGTDDESVTPQQNAASVAVDKTADVTTGVVAGQTITYTYVVTNDGNVSLTNVTVSDIVNQGNGTLSAIDPVSVASLEVGASTTFAATYTVTQQDIDDQIGIQNTATASAFFGQQEVTGNDNESVGVENQEAFIEFTKTGTFNDENQNGLADVGETISYSFTVENTGNVTLTNVTVTDLKATVSGGPVTINAGETDNTSFTAEYTITQTDIDAGKVDNTATADSDESEPVDDDETTILSQGAAFTMTKIAEITTDVDNDGLADLNDVVTYSFSVTNTGNLTLFNIEIKDPMYSTSNAVCTIPQLSPGETISDLCSFNYATTKSDIDNGSIVNTANATAKDSEDNEVEETDTNPSDNTTTTITDDYPIANPDYATTNEDIPVIIGSGKNDENGDGNQTINIISNPSFGNAQYTDNDTPDNVTDDYINYQPEPNYYGKDELIYEICDSNGDCDTALVVITITSVDEIPVANADYDETWESVPVEILTGSNDHGDDSPFSVAITTAPEHGNIIMDDNNTPHDLSDDHMVYTPVDGFYGMDELIYQVCDEDNDCDTALVKIKVKAFTNLQCPDNIKLDGCDLTVVNASTTGFDYSETAVSISLEDFENAGGTLTGDCEITAITYQDEAIEDGCPNPIATIYRTFTVTDDCDSIFSCTQTITVEDNIAPEIQCNPITVELRPNGQYILNSTDIERISRGTTDNCTVDEDIEIEVFPRSFSCINTDLPIYVTVTATDLCGNTSVCRALVTVTENDPPVANCQDVSVYLNENGQARIFAGTVDNGSSDACGIDIVSLDQSTFDCSDIGDNIVTLTVYDPAGNQAACQATVTVIDTIQPVITCPDDIVVTAGEGICGATVDFDVLTSDNCTNTDVIYSIEPGSVFPIGTTEVTATAIDEAGNTAICSFNITVADSTAPEIVCPDDITVSNDQGECGAIVNFEAIATDNCSSAITYSVEPGSLFPIGTTEVIATATDDAGNATDCSFTVTVNDNEAPVVICPDDIFVSNDSGECGAIVNFDATATDNCSSAIAYSIEPGSLFPVGITEVIATATDDAGNAVSCTFTVTVIDDEAPVVICPDDIFVSNDSGECGAIVNFEATATDNCSSAMTYSIEPGSLFPVGTTEVIATATDDGGNAVTCSFNVTVNDEEIPEITCGEDTVLTARKGECEISLDLPQPVLIRDNCDFSYSNNFNNTTDASGVYPVGTTTVVWTVSDNAGNTSSCSYEVTVISAPVAVDDTASTLEDTPIDVLVLENDMDCSEGLIASSVKVTNTPANGTVTVNPETGATTYTPNPGFEGTDTYNYEVCNNQGLCDEATVTVVINGTFNSPIAEDDVYNTGDCLAITMIVTTNDSDPDGDSLTIPAVINDVENGTLIQNEDGSFEYTPDRGFTGLVTFTYEICDGTESTSLCDQATVTINVSIDTDCDGIINIDDIDDDNDGILDIDEGFTDFDGDGIPNHLDIDTDSDGILDNIEGQLEGQHIDPVWSDTDGDGWDDAYDPDNGGIYFELADTDEDGTPDFIDLDSDDDGNPDEIEGFDATGPENEPDSIPDIYPTGTDSDNDGIDDGFDTIDGWDNYQNPIGGNAPLPDYDDDGIRDWRDADDGKPISGEDNPQTPLCEMLIPNGFSPNGDGFNDYFRIYCFEDYPNAQIEIYNRWGNLIYEQEDYGNEDRWGTTDAWWNGRSTHKWTVGKEKLPPGTYFYILNLNDGSEPITGSIFLNR